jgi:hypothetical protein
MSKLQDALAQVKEKKRGRPCAVGVLLAMLPADERDALTKALMDPARNKMTLSDAIRVAYGAEVRGHSLAYHARGGCACEK